MGRRLAGFALLVAAGLTAASLGPIPQPDLPGPLELLPHVAAYGASAALLLWLSDRSGDARRGDARAASIAIALVLLGVALELGQLVVGRDVELSDVVANLIGVGGAVAIRALLRRARISGSEADRPP